MKYLCWIASLLREGLVPLMTHNNVESVVRQERVGQFNVKMRGEY